MSANYKSGAVGGGGSSSSCNIGRTLNYVKPTKTTSTWNEISCTN